MKKQLFLILILFSSLGYSQIFSPIVIDSTTIIAAETIADTIPKKPKSIRPLRLGVKVGIPTIATVNIEYLTPLFDNRVSLTSDFMFFKKNYAEGLFNFSTFEFGSNVYFKNTGRGFYGGISYFSLNTGIGFTDYAFNGDGGTTVIDDGKVEVKFHTLNLKLGFKAGRTVFFRVEAGYAIGKIPTTVRVNSVDYDVYDYDDVPSVFGLGSSGVLLFNIGFGVGFF